MLLPIVVGAAFGAVGWGSNLMAPSTRWLRVPILSSSPENSQVTTKKRPLPEKSAWLGPRQPGYFRSLMVCQVWGSANRIVSYCSIITTAVFPSGVK